MLSVLLDPAAFWTMFGTFEDDPIRWDPWQVDLLRNPSRIRARKKAPQIGFSYLCAAEATWSGIMFDDDLSGFVSVDQREASDKVLMSYKLWDGLPGFLKRWVPVVQRSREELWFGSMERPSRLLSLPSTSAMRGRSMHVYLDESDFYRDGGRDAWRATIGRIARGKRAMIGSTVWGQDTILQRIEDRQGDEEAAEEADRELGEEASQVDFAELPWTVAVNPDVLESVELARNELSEEDFLEEYGCVRGGKGGSTFPPALIREATIDPVQIVPDWITGEVRLAGETVRLAPGAMAGYDVGKSRNPSVMTVLEPVGSTWDQTVLWEPELEEGDRPGLTAQQGFLDRFMDANRECSLVIDGQGIGSQAAEFLQGRWGRRVVIMMAGSRPKGTEPMDRVEMATTLKRELEGGQAKGLRIAQDRQQAREIERTQIIGGSVEQRGSRRKRHYDRFWTLCYALWGVRTSSTHRRRSRYSERGLDGADIGGRTRVPV